MNLWIISLEPFIPDPDKSAKDIIVEFVPKTN